MESRTRAETDRMFPGGVTDTLYKIDDLLSMNAGHYGMQSRIQ